MTGNKFKNLILQEKKTMTEVVKMIEFRQVFMTFLENYLILAGF